MKIHEKYINRCLEIAKNGLGSTAPNPMVGCIIVHEGKIIGEGYTSPYGGDHAEVNAINSVKNKSILRNATLYVTLEPCSHHGKTPPCSDLIIKHEIPEVVIGCIDDNPEVAGKGIKKLKTSGCKVIVGILKEKCKVHHKRFFTFHNKKRPYIILKWAQTSNGFIAPLTKQKKQPVWITNKYSKQLVHKWRNEEQAILVGGNTVIEDNPQLTSRSFKGSNPVRIVVDKRNSLSKDLNVFNNEAKTILLDKNQINFSKPIAKQIANILYKEHINSVIIEGGAKTLKHFIEENLWDEARVFTGNKNFKNGVEAPKLEGRLTLEKQLSTDNLKIYMND